MVCQDPAVVTELLGGFPRQESYRHAQLPWALIHVAVALLFSDTSAFLGSYDAAYLLDPGDVF